MTLFGNICRTCLGGLGQDMYAFEMRCVSATGGDTEGITVGALLQAVVKSLAICPGMPAALCGSCLNELMRAKAFLEKCEKSETALRNMLTTAQETQAIGTPFISSVTQARPEPYHSVEDVQQQQPPIEPMTVVQVEEERASHQPVAEEKPQPVEEESRADDWAATDHDYEDTSLPRERPEATRKVNGSLPIRPDGIRCPDCGIMFIHNKSMQKHRQNYHGNNEGNVFLQPPALVATAKPPPPPEKQQQPTPPTAAEDVAGNDTLGNRPLVCEKCGISFGHKKSLQNHVKFMRCKEARKLNCCICEREFVRKNALIDHVVNVHGTVPVEVDPMPELMCALCAANEQPELLSIADFKQHMLSHRAHDISVGNHSCAECGRCFTMFSTLKDHMRTHSGEKPFQCSICQKGFSQSTNLRQHMNRHNKLKNFKCSSCPAAFVSKGELLTHTRVHSGLHPYACECGQRFTTSTSLIKHKRRHTGEKPYQCKRKGCEKQFSTLNVLKNHLRVHRETFEGQTDMVEQHQVAPRSSGRRALTRSMHSV